MLKKISCVECGAALRYFPSVTDHDHFYSRCPLPSLSLISSKDRGGLVKPSTSVYRIVCFTESCIKSMISTPSKLKKNAMLNSVNASLNNPFPDLDQYDKENLVPLEDLHSTQLSKKIISTYIKIRLYAYEKQFNSELHKKKIGLRQQSTKLLIFKGI